MIIIKGIDNHKKIATIPAIKIKTWDTMPNIIKTILHIAPIILEKVLEIRVLKNSFILKPFG